MRVNKEGTVANANPKARYATFWFLWIGASTLGVVLLMLILFMSSRLAGSLLGTSVEDKVPYAPLIGISYGIMQWLVLRRHIDRAGWWAVTSAVGFLLGFVIWGAVIEMLEAISGGTLDINSMVRIFYPVLGASLGIAGWLVLRKHFDQAGWWIPVTVLSWVLTGLLVGKSIDKNIEILVIGLMPTAITGLMLVWLLHNPLSNYSGRKKSAP